MLAKRRKILIREAKAAAREHRANARCAWEVGEDRAAQEEEYHAQLAEDRAAALAASSGARK